MDTYVNGEFEVILTGRTASRAGVGGKMVELVEITPANKDDGTWKKWLPMASLFKVKEATLPHEPNPF